MGKRVRLRVKSVVDTPLERRDLLNDIQRVMKVAFDKFENERTKNSDRISWGRLIVNGVAAAGAVLRDVDLDALAARIEKLEGEAKAE